MNCLCSAFAFTFAYTITHIEWINFIIQSNMLESFANLNSQNLDELN